MSDTNDAASKTEEPTQRKLDQAREKGDVVKTMDLGAFASLAGAAGVVALAGGWLSRDLAYKLEPFLAHPQSMSLEGQGGVDVARYAMLAAAPLLVGVLAAAAFGGTAANLLQTGLMFTPDKLKFDFKKLSPAAGFKRLFGVDALINFVKTLLKVAATALIGWWILKPHWAALAQLSALSPVAILPLCADILKRLVFAVAALTLCVAGADWMIQRQRFMARMRMTREAIPTSAPARSRSATSARAVG